MYKEAEGLSPLSFAGLQRRQFEFEKVPWTENTGTRG
jgi:hypothetical protein